MVYSTAQIAVLAIFAAIAASYDVAQHRVPNALVTAIAGAGAAVQWVSGGWDAGALGLVAAGIVAGLALPFWASRRIGGGDLKLAAAAAVWVGPIRIPTYLLATAVVGGLVAAACYALSSREVRAAVRANLYRFYAPKLSGVGSAQPGRRRVPYGVAIAAGAVFAVCR